MQLNLAKPGHLYVANLTKKPFFADTSGIAHKTPLFAGRFRNYVQTKYCTGVTVDAIKDIDSLRSMPLVDDNDNGDQAIEAFKKALTELWKTLRDIVRVNHMTELDNEIKRVLESNDPKVLKRFRGGPALGKMRNLVVGQVTEYFEGFHLDLLSNPPADTDIPAVNADRDDVKVNNDEKIEQPGDKTQTFFHHGAFLPRHQHLQPKGQRCYPCLRYDLSPMSQNGHPAGFGWLTPGSRAKSLELGVSSEASAKEDWFERSPIRTARP